MKQIKSLFILALLLVVAISGIQVAYNRGIVQQQHLDQLKLTGLSSYLASNQSSPEIKMENSGQLMQSAQEQGSTLFSRGKEAAFETRKVLGEYIEPVEEEDQKPLHDRALNHGLYLYCQQVVNEYESNN